MISGSETPTKVRKMKEFAVSCLRGAFGVLNIKKVPVTKNVGWWWLGVQLKIPITNSQKQFLLQFYLNGLNTKSIMLCAW